MTRQIKVAYLLDKSNIWIKEYLLKSNLLKRNTTKYKSKIFLNANKIRNFDIVFILSYTKILKNSFLKKNKLNLIIHASDLPKNKGFAPMQWQILKNKNKIIFSMFKANSKVDNGDIFKKKSIILNGTELYDELREKQAFCTFSLIKYFLKKYPKVKFSRQFGKSSFNRKRNKNDSKININLSIKKIFNKLRIANNKEWPSFFYYKNKKFIIKIYKTKK
jgi:methionyl-tRNA formyltransferase